MGDSRPAHNLLALEDLHQLKNDTLAQHSLLLVVAGLYLLHVRHGGGAGRGVLNVDHAGRPQPGWKSAPELRREVWFRW